MSSIEPGNIFALLKRCLKAYTTELQSQGVISSAQQTTINNAIDSFNP